MTEKERESDKKVLEQLEQATSLCPTSPIKAANLHLIRASQLLLKVPPDVDSALEIIGKASGHLSNELGI
jgi:hypothetical protein